MTDGPQAPPAAAPNPSPLAAFLAQRDCPCPHCRYNLRGATAAACPECGRTIVLGVVPQGPLAGRAIACFIVLLWILLSAGTHALRQAHENYLAAAPLPGWLVNSSITPGMTITYSPTVTASGSSSRSPIVSTMEYESTSKSAPPPPPPEPLRSAAISPAADDAPSDSGASPVPLPAAPAKDDDNPWGKDHPWGVGNPWGVGVVTPKAPVTMTALALTRPPIAPMAWIRLGWWSALCLLALLGLLLLWAMHTRRMTRSASAQRLTLWGTAALLALYAAYHAAVFSVEVRQWL